MKVNSNSVLKTITEQTPTKLWIDSIVLQEMEYALARGIVGATCNPLIILKVLQEESDIWMPVIAALTREQCTASEDELSWMIIQNISQMRSKLLMNTFREYNGLNGRLSIQTDPKFFRDADRILAQAVAFDKLAENIIVKIPVTSAGITAIEEATYQGISINATVCFTLQQAVEVAEAVERGLDRRIQEQKDVSTMGSVCTLMLGRLDDHVAAYCGAQGISISKDCLDLAAVSVFKKTYALYRERQYRLRLLAAGFRNDYHWKELIGGDVVISLPYAWLKRIEESNIAVNSYMEQEVSQSVIEELLEKVPDYRKAYQEERGGGHYTFDLYPPVINTLREFSEGSQKMTEICRNVLLPEQYQV